MNKEAVERSSMWTDKAVLFLIGIWADEEILQQWIFAQKRPICEKTAELWIHPFIFPNRKVGDIDCLEGSEKRLRCFAV